MLLLSLKYNENDNYTLLDSAGLQTPLIQDDELLFDEKNEQNNGTDSDQKRKKYENLYKDKTQTENFIQNLIIYTSDMLLIVVGKLTFNEQRLINKIKKEIETGPKNNNKKYKPLYIIHNLTNFQTKKQVDEHIKEVLLKSASFNLKKMTNIRIKEKNNIQNDKQNNNDDKRYILVEDDNENEVKTYHLIMGREDTEAGDYYNHFTYNFLKEQFNVFTERKPLSIIEVVKDRFVEWSNDLLEEQIKPENIEIVKDDESQNEIKYIYKKLDNKNNNNTNIVPKACLSDELGLNIYRSNGYEPCYYYYIENDEKLVIVLEIPGNKKIDEKYADSDSKEIIVKGSKSMPNESIKPLYNHSIKFGKFCLHIPYGNKIQISDENPIEGEDTYKDGIYSFKFKLMVKRKNANRK